MRILLGIIGLLFPVELALAVTLTASSVTENFAPPLNTNTSCLANVSVVADGQERISATSSVAYCPQSSVPSNYEVTYTWSPAPDQLMTSLTMAAVSIPTENCKVLIWKSTISTIQAARPHC